MTYQNKKDAQPESQHQTLFESLFQTMPLGVVYQNADGAIILANPAAERILGLSFDQMQGRKSVDPNWHAIHPDGSPFPGDEHPAMVALRTGKIVKDVVMGVFRPETGDICWINITAIPEFTPGKPTPYQVYATFQDITDSRQIESELHELIANYKLVSENTHDVIWVLDIETQKYAYVSPAVYNLRGYTPAEIMKQTLSESLTPKSLKYVSEILPISIEKYLNHEKLPDPPYHIDQPCKDGSIVQTEVNASIVHTPEGRLQIVGISRDISERKKAFDLIHKTQAQLEMAQQIAHMGSWEKDLMSGVSSWSKEMFHLFQFDPQKGVPGFQQYLQKIHPEDRSTLLEKEKAIAELGGSVTYVLRVLLDNAEICFYESSLQVNKDDQGNLVSMVGTVIDITEKHIAGDLLKQSEARLNQAQRIARLGSWERNLKKNVLIWSDEIYRIFDIKAEEFGANYEAFLKTVHPDDRNRVDLSYSNSLQRKEPFEITYRLQTRDGQIKYVLDKCTTSYGEDGTPLVSMGTVQDITERIEAEHRLRTEEAKLRSANERFELLAGNIQEVFWLFDSFTQRLAYISPAYETIWDRTSASLYENPRQYIDTILPEDQGLMFAALADQARGIPTELEYRISQKNGSIRWIWDRSVPVFSEDGQLTHTAGVASDITESKLVEMDLIASEEKYRQLSQELERRVNERTAEVRDLYDNAPTGYHSEDAQGYFKMVNQTELNWLGYTLDEMVGKMKVADILTPEGRIQLCEKLPGFMSQGSISDFETEFVRKDGSLLPVMLNAVAIFDQDGLFSTNRVTVFDNTERKKAQDALRKSEQSLRASRDDLSAANASLEKASRLKDEFLASMSHELRTPLTGILGLSEAMELGTYGPLTDRQNKALKNIEKSGHHLLELINEILDLSKIEADKLDLQFEQVSITEICQVSLQLTKGMAQQKQLKVGFSTNQAAASLSADPRRLKQMLVNLLGNAVKFTPEGGSIGIDVEANQTEQFIQISVWDTGIGIRSEDLSRLFKPFVQLDSSLARQYSGTGLGLSLVSRLAEMHGGSIRVESTYGQGSRFSLTLPWQGSELPETSHVKEPIRMPEYPKGSLATVLLADDNEVILNTVCEFLNSKSYQVISARNGKEMVDLTIEFRPDIILADVQMPGSDGLTAIRAVRALPDPKLAGIPIIAITALAMPGDEERCLEAGANLYVSKPMPLPKIIRLIQDLL